MPEDSISVGDFMEEAAAILAHSKATRLDGMVMVTVEPDGGPPSGATGELDDDDDRDEQEDAGAGEESDDDKPFVKDDGTPFTTRDYNALRASLKAARDETRQARRAAGKPADDGDKDKPDAEAVNRAADARWKPVVVRQAARAALAEAGLVLPRGREESALKKALRLIDANELDVNSDGDVDGLEDQIADLKADYPELFARPRAPRVETTPRGGGPEPAKSTAEILADALTR